MGGLSDQIETNTYKFTLIGLVLSATVWLGATFCVVDYFEKFIDFLESIEKSKMVEIIVPMALFILFVLLDLIRMQRAQKIELGFQRWDNPIHDVLSELGIHYHTSGLESVKEMDAIVQGKTKPSRVFSFAPLEVKAIREEAGLSQSNFALMPSFLFIVFL